MTEDTMKHTPGPWLIERKGLIIKGIGPCIPDEYAGSAWIEVSEADARLIAAAPDLLDVANKTIDDLAEEYLITADCDDDWIYDTLGSVLAGIYFAARAAISKATGGQ